MTAKKGKKRLRNVPVLHSELKQRHQVHLTPTAWESLKREAVGRGISVSELIEELARTINCPTDLPHA